MNEERPKKKRRDGSEIINQQTKNEETGNIKILTGLLSRCSVVGGSSDAISVIHFLILSFLCFSCSFMPTRLASPCGFWLASLPSELLIMRQQGFHWCSLDGLHHCGVWLMEEHLVDINLNKHSWIYTRLLVDLKKKLKYKM